ncbi:acyl-CoA thioesterase [Oceanobacillus halophilus]|uniref:Acyl-CoA thioesterase n=2 Tax=Oceanobacillus halophilus TaxID=930130 RepID=A0A495A7W7_9BACI|nr:acyl-CoA thioesterase [Oceanobacillus halophilus]
MMDIITNIIVKEDDIDDLEHVNNSVYLNYLEKARGQWFRRAGISFENMHVQNLATVVLKINITFIKEAKLGDLLKIKTTPFRLGNSSFEVKQEIYNQVEEKITEAIVTSVMLNKTERKSIPVIEKIARQF